MGGGRHDDSNIKKCRKIESDLRVFPWRLPVSAMLEKETHQLLIGRHLKPEARGLMISSEKDSMRVLDVNDICVKCPALILNLTDSKRNAICV